MLAEILCQHQDDGNLYKFRRLELASARQFDPATLAVNFQSNARDQDNYQQHQSQDIQDGSNLNQAAIVAESNCQHRNQCNPQPDQLLLPVSFGGNGVANLPGAKADNDDRQGGDQPIKISQTSFLDNCDHKSVTSKR